MPTTTTEPTPRYFKQIPTPKTLQNAFPLNFILYPAFFSNACSDSLLGIISNHVVDKVKDERDKIDEYFYARKLSYASLSKSNDEDLELPTEAKEKKNEFRGKSSTGSFHSAPLNLKDEFDMETIITPSLETTKACATKVRKNTSTSLLDYNEQTRKELETLNRAKAEFLRLQQYKRSVDPRYDVNRNNMNLGSLDHSYLMRQQHAPVVNNYSGGSSSHSGSRSPVFGEAIEFAPKPVGKSELREFLATHAPEGSFDLIAVVFTLLNYFKSSGRWAAKVNKKAYGFTVKVTNDNKDDVLKFIEDLETHQGEPIKCCSITHKKKYYNFHVSCANQEQVEVCINILMNKYCTKLSLKMFGK